MVPTKVLQRGPVDDRIRRRPEPLDEDVLRIGPGDAVHRIEDETEPPLNEQPERIKVE